MILTFPARRRNAALAAVSTLLGAPLICICLTGCARQIIQEKASDKIDSILPKYIGPADKYETRIEGDSAGALIRGHVKSVHVEGTNVQLQPMLNVASMTLDFTEISVDIHAGALRSIGSASFSCRISEYDLDRYVRSLRTNIPNLRVALHGDHVVVSAKPEVIGIGAPVSIEGTIVPRGDGSYLNFEPDKARLVFIPVPGIVLDYISRRLNPVVDLSNLRIPIQATQTEVRDGYLLLSGSVAPDDVMRAATKPQP